jgi:hypothetical protein
VVYGELFTKLRERSIISDEERMLLTREKDHGF